MLWARSRWSVRHHVASPVACWGEPAPMKGLAGERFLGKESDFQLRKSGELLACTWLKSEKLCPETNNADLERRE